MSRISLHWRPEKVLYCHLTIPSPGDTLTDLIEYVGQKVSILVFNFMIFVLRLYFNSSRVPSVFDAEISAIKVQNNKIE